MYKCLCIPVFSIILDYSQELNCRVMWYLSLTSWGTIKTLFIKSLPHLISTSTLAWEIPGTAEPGRLPSMGSHRVGHDWSDLAAAAIYLASNVFTSCQHLLSSLFDYSCSSECEVLSHWGFNLYFPSDQLHWSFHMLIGYLYLIILWRNIYSNPLPISKLDYVTVVELCVC